MSRFFNGSVCISPTTQSVTKIKCTLWVFTCEADCVRAVRHMKTHDVHSEKIIDRTLGHSYRDKEVFRWDGRGCLSCRAVTRKYH